VTDRCTIRYAYCLVAPQRAGEEGSVIIHVQDANGDRGRGAGRTSLGAVSGDDKAVVGTTFVIQRLVGGNAASLGVHAERQQTADVAVNHRRDRVDDAIVGRLVAVDGYDAADLELSGLVFGDLEVVAVALEPRRFVVQVVDEDADAHHRPASLGAAVPSHDVELDRQLVGGRERLAVDLGASEDLAGIRPDQHQPLSCRTGTHLQHGSKISRCFRQEGLAEAKVTRESSACMKAPSEEI